MQAYAVLHVIELMHEMQKYNLAIEAVSCGVAPGGLPGQNQGSLWRRILTYQDPV